MEWSKITFRKETVTKENKRKISDETGTHTSKLKLAHQSSIKQTQMFSDREASQRSSYRYEFSSRNFATGDNLQRGREDNICSDAISIPIPDTELDNINAEGENEETRNNNTRPKISEAVNINENSTGEFDNLRNDIESNNGVRQASANTHHIYSNITSNPATRMKVYKTDKTPKSLEKGVSMEKINNDVEENSAETERKKKFNDHCPRFANKLQNKENLMKCGSEVTISSGLNLDPLEDKFKSPDFSTDARASNDYEDIKKTQIRKERYQHENIPLAKEETIKNNFKSYSSLLPHSSKRSAIDAFTNNRSVNDLISYFECLSSSFNKSSVKLTNQKKSKIKSSVFKKDLKDEHSIKVNRGNSSSSTQEILKNEINCRKHPTEINTGDIQPDVNLSAGQNSKQNAEFGMSSSSNRKGKRLHFEENNKTHSENDAKKVKDHTFMFNDSVPNGTEYLKSSNPKRCRSRFTRKNIKPQPLSGLHDTRNHVYAPSNLNTTKSGVLFNNNNPNATSVISKASNENRMPWKENSINRRVHEANKNFHKNKPTATEDGSNMRSFFGILLTMIFFGIIHKVISGYF